MVRTAILTVLLGGALLAAPAVAHAEHGDTAVERETVTEYGGPSRGMLFTGVFVFGASYGTAVVVAAAGDEEGDRKMVIPLVGPWLALGDRPNCNEVGCDTETTNRVLIGADGVFQGVGALLTVGAFLYPRRVTRARTGTAPTVHIAPVRTGRGGYGLVAFGRF